MKIEISFPLLPLSRSFSLDRAITIRFFDSFFFCRLTLVPLSSVLSIRFFKLYYLPLLDPFYFLSLSLFLSNFLCILQKIFAKDFPSSELPSEDLLIYLNNNVTLSSFKRTMV